MMIGRCASPNNPGGSFRVHEENLLTLQSSATLGDGHAANAEAERVPKVSDVIGQLNEKYHWTLPVAAEFPAGSILREIWNLDATITNPPPNSLEFQALTHPYALSSALTGRFVISVEANLQAPQPVSAAEGGTSWRPRRREVRRKRVLRRK